MRYGSIYLLSALQVADIDVQRTRLREQLEQQLAEINTLKSLSPNVSSAQKRLPNKGGNEVKPITQDATSSRKSETVLQPQQNFHGVVQRLVQKEKQVIQLQTELDRYRAQNPTEDKEAVSNTTLHKIQITY